MKCNFSFGIPSGHRRSGHQWGGVFWSSELPDKGKDTLSYEQCDDAVYPPREVSAEEEDVYKGRYDGAEKYRAPEKRLFFEFLGKSPHQAKEGVIEDRYAREVDDQEDRWVNAVPIHSLLHDRMEFRYQVFYQRRPSPFMMLLVASCLPAQ